MADESVCFLTLSELAERIRTQQVSPIDVVQAHLERCARLNPTLHAFITLVPELALEAAQQATEEIAAGHYRGALHGVPIGVKDMFDTAGILTTYGSGFYRHNIPTEDAAAVRFLKQAGAIVIGKCNTHEFAAGSTTNNPWFGATRNPWDIARSPGGSSGGSAAAVAAFLCAGATGTDTSGSIRDPAACNGLVGLKPTYGRVSLQGIFPNAISLDHPGSLTRTVRDAGLLLQGMVGYVREDFTSVNIPVPDFVAEIDAGVQGMRIAFCPDLHFEELDEAVSTALEETGQVLLELGASVETVPFELHDIITETRHAIQGAEFAVLHRERFHQHPEGYGEDVRTSLEKAAMVTLDAYVLATQRRQILRRGFDELLEKVDALLLPSAPCVAPLVEDGTSTINGCTVDFGKAGIPLYHPINVVGLPALAMPMGFSQGLPLSAQLVGPAWGEAKLLRIGHAYEQATLTMRQQRPPYGN